MNAERDFRHGSWEVTVFQSYTNTGWTYVAREINGGWQLRTFQTWSTPEKAEAEARTRIETEV